MSEQTRRRTRKQPSSKVKQVYPEMLRQTQTEKLREEIASRYWLATTLMAQSIKSNTIDLSLTEEDFAKLLPSKKMPYHNFADRILQACQEEGLKFVTTTPGIPSHMPRIEEIEI